MAVLVGLVQVVPGQRDLDGSTQQTNPAQSVRARQRDPQVGPRGLAVALAPTQQRLAGLRIDTEGAGPREGCERALGITLQPEYLAELVVALACGPAVGVLQCLAGSDQPRMELAVVVGGHQ